MVKKKRTVFIVLAVLTVVFIWGNSLVSAEISRAISNWVKEIVNLVLGAVNAITQKDNSLSSDGILRKFAHTTEFCALGIFLMQSFEKRKEYTTTVILLGVITALIDETIQLFVPGRGSLVSDIWVDMLGFMIGVALVDIFFLCKKEKGDKKL